MIAILKLINFLIQNCNMKLTNQELLNDAGNYALDINLSQIENQDQRQRRLISKILSAANIIATKSRSGIANVVYVHKDHLTEQYTEQGHLAGISLKPLDDKNIAIISKTPSDDDDNEYEITIKLN